MSWWAIVQSCIASFRRSSQRKDHESSSALENRASAGVWAIHSGFCKVPRKEMVSAKASCHATDPELSL